MKSKSIKAVVMVECIAGGHGMEGLEERDEQSSTNLSATSQTNAAGTTVDEDEEVKALSRKEKNRIAAQKSRMKKIERIKELEKVSSYSFFRDLDDCEDLCGSLDFSANLPSCSVKLLCDILSVSSSNHFRLILSVVNDKEISIL